MRERCRDSNTDISRKGLRKKVEKAKRDCWQSLCDELEKDIWGKAYKIATKKIIASSRCSMEAGEETRIVRELFPRRREHRSVKEAGAALE